MRFSFEFLQSFFSRKLPNPEKLGKILTLHSFEVKKTEKKDNDFILDIDILPNRAGDCFSHLGIAREISTLLKLKMIFPERIFSEEKEKKIQEFLNVKVKNKKACKRYNAKLITNVKVRSSPSWIIKRLNACGLSPINTIVDILNYVMLETGQPLHAFDFEKIEGKKRKEIIIRNAKEGEKIVSLDGEEYELNKKVLVIADKKGPLAIAGIKGGKRAEITETTKIVLLESANFDPLFIRRASKKIDLKTEASLRFEYGLDPNLTDFAIKRACYLIQKIAGGKVISGLIDFYPEKEIPKRIILDLNYTEKLLGKAFSKTQIEEIFKSLNFKIISASKEKLLIEIPTFRRDINLQEDLIEEIGRIYGWQKIPSKLPLSLLVLPQKNLEIFWESMAKNVLKELGLTEVYNYSFVNEKDKEIFGLKDILELENPVSSEHKYLRPSLLPNLLKNIARNERFLKDIKLFELGKIFRGVLLKEKRMLAGVFSNLSFFEVKGIVEILFQKMGIPKVWFDEYKATPEDSPISIWLPQRSAEIKINGEEIGFLGEIQNRVLSALNIKSKPIAFDLDFEKIINLASAEVIYQPFSIFPAITRDISVLVPIFTKTEEILNEIEIAGGENLVDVDLFDIFEGEELPEDKKSLSFHLVFQAKDRAISPKEVNEIQERIIKILEEKGWEVRK